MPELSPMTWNSKWQQAIALGSVWGAYEIVFGSLLHNLRIPFSGNLLTAGSLILLIAVAQIQSGKGMYFRAAIICAALKTLSPSAIIFGPMVAILAQGLIFELFLLFFQRTLAAYLLAAVVAMSWNLIQKLLNYLIYYGQTLAEMYSNLMEYARQQLHTDTELVWLPLLLLWILYAVFGLLAGITGIRIGKQLRKQELPPPSIRLNSPEKVSPKQAPECPRHPGFLLLNTVLLFLAFYLMSKTEFSTWSLPLIGIIVFWSVRYRRALRQLGKPKLWITFLLLTLLSAAIFSWMPGSSINLKESILISLAMNERALFLILGMTVTGTELYNPCLWKTRKKGSLFRLAKGITTARENLPAIMQNIPVTPQIRKHPGELISSLLRLSMNLSGLPPGLPQLNRSAVTLLSGTKGSGKTCFLTQFTKDLSAEGWSIAGILAPRMSEEEGMAGYLLINLQTKIEYPFLHKESRPNKTDVGKYRLCRKGYRAGLKALHRARKSNPDLIIIDEIGPLELRNKGWAAQLKELLENTDIPLLLVVRETLVEEVKKKWNTATFKTLSLEEAKNKSSRLLAKEIRLKS